MSSVATAQQRNQEWIDLLVPAGSPKEQLAFLSEMPFQIPLLSLSECADEYRVPGCQSVVFVKAELRDQQVWFSLYAQSTFIRALVDSQISVFQGCSPETIFHYTPTWIEETQLHTVLSPTRLNGIQGLRQHLRKLVIGWVSGL